MSEAITDAIILLLENGADPDALMIATEDMAGQELEPISDLLSELLN